MNQTSFPSTSHWNEFENYNWNELGEENFKGMRADVFKFLSNYKTRLESFCEFENCCRSK